MVLIVPVPGYSLSFTVCSNNAMEVSLKAIQISQESGSLNCAISDNESSSVTQKEGENRTETDTKNKQNREPN